MSSVAMDSLIPIINKLQDAFARMGISSPLDLPQIAVVGAQSAGKSSVLENCVGKDFLPRGSGIVTRRPLILQLVHDKGTEYGEFAHAPNRKFTDFSAIRKEIEDETDRMTGNNKGISNVPISLRVHSPNVVNLTIIDLPGLTKVAVGDQPHDIERQIRNMILEFIEKPNCLILAVSPANTDLANSDALKLAKSVDPEGVRTIGVHTKLDLMDEGTDARDVFANKVIPLRRGYIGVVNRSQKDINGNKDIHAAQEAERQFFLRHPAYRDMASKMGTAYLQKTLNQQLTNHIRDVLPSLKASMTKQLSSMEKEVEGIKSMDPNDRGTKTKMLIKNVNTFIEKVNECIEGGKTFSFTELSSGAKIAQIFHEQFPYEIARRDFDETEIRQEIAVAIRNVQGIRVGLFTPDQAFEAVIRKIIENLREPTIECVENVFQELGNAISTAGEKLCAFPALRDACESLAKRIADGELQKTIDQVNILVNLELCYINTSHPDFNDPTLNRKGKNVKASDEKTDNKPAPIVVRKGYLSLPIGTFGTHKSSFFVLKTDCIEWYKDNHENPKDLKHTIKLEGLRVTPQVKSTDVPTFEIYDPVNKYVVKEVKTLICRCQNREEHKGWLASLLRAGIYPDKEKKENDMKSAVSMDPILERQVAEIRDLVDSYMRIVYKTLKDLIPKCIMFMLVEGTRVGVKEELLGNLYREFDDDTLMDEDPAEKERRKELLLLYSSTKEALNIIKDVSSSTHSTAMPPPIDPSLDIHVSRDSFAPGMGAGARGEGTAHAAPRRPGEHAGAAPRRPVSNGAVAPQRRPPSRPTSMMVGAVPQRSNVPMSPSGSPRQAPSRPAGNPPPRPSVPNRPGS